MSPVRAGASAVTVRSTVEFDGTTIWLGGHAVTGVEGVLQP
jgi:hypothetical protein